MSIRVQQVQKNQEVHKKDLFVMPSDCNFRICWDICCMLIIFYELIMIPFRLSFEDETDDLSGLAAMDLPFNIIFMFDIFLNFNTSVFRKGIQIYDRKIITLTYLKIWFWLDMASSFPYSSVIDVIQETESQDSIQQSAMILRLVKFFRFFKVLRLLRIAKLKTIFTKIVEYLNFSDGMLGLLGFFKLSMIVILLAHWLACLWNLVGKLDDENNWLIIYGIQNDSWDIKYISSIYWSITTMITVGFGDIYPVNEDEKLFTIFAMLLACGVFAYTMNTMGSVLSSLDQYSEEFKKQMSQVNRYLKNKQIKVDRQINIKKYLEYIYEKQEQNEQETLMLQQLNSTLKNDLIYEINGKVLQGCNLLMNTFSKRFLYNITLILHEKIAVPEEIIIQEDSPQLDDNSMYFIQNGEVEIYFNRTNTLLQNINNGSYFGEISFFTGQQRSSSVRSTDFTNLFLIKRQIFLELIVKFPQDYEKFCQIKDNINFYQDYDYLNIECYSCHQTTHVAKNCPNVSFFFQKDKFILEIQKNQNQFRQSLKFKRPKYYNALKDNQLIKHQFDEFQSIEGVEEMISEYIQQNEIQGDGTEDLIINIPRTYEKGLIFNEISQSQTSQSEIENFQEKLIGPSGTIKRKVPIQLNVASNMVIFQNNKDIKFYNKLLQYQEYDKVKNFENYFVKNNIDTLHPKILALLNIEEDQKEIGHQFNFQKQIQKKSLLATHKFIQLDTEENNNIKTEREEMLIIKKQ